jgi:hypothetical protein
MMWDRDNRDHDSLCLAVEHSIGEVEDCGDHDITACVIRLRSGQFGLSFWPMHVASAFENPSEGDLRWAKDALVNVDMACEAFEGFLTDKVNAGEIEETVPTTGPATGHRQFVFDSLEAIGSAVDAYRNNNHLSAMHVAQLAKEGAARHA